MCAAWLWKRFAGVARDVFDAAFNRRVLKERIEICRQNSRLAIGISGELEKCSMVWKRPGRGCQPL